VNVLVLKFFSYLFHPQTLILLLAGKPADDVKAGVGLLHTYGVHVSVLGAGYDDKNVLGQIASDKDDVKTFKHFRQILQYVRTIYYRYGLVSGIAKPGEHLLFGISPNHLRYKVLSTCPFNSFL